MDPARTLRVRRCPRRSHWSRARDPSRANVWSESAGARGSRTHARALFGLSVGARGIARVARAVARACRAIARRFARPLAATRCGSLPPSLRSGLSSAHAHGPLASSGSRGVDGGAGIRSCALAARTLGARSRARDGCRACAHGVGETARQSSPGCAPDRSDFDGGTGGRCGRRPVGRESSARAACLGRRVPIDTLRIRCAHVRAALTGSRALPKMRARCSDPTPAWLVATASACARLFLRRSRRHGDARAVRPRTHGAHTG
jgi:hypothetical protein